MLVEAMVGAAIVTIALASLYHAIIESASHNRMAEERRYALMVAQSMLAQVGPIIPQAPGQTEGTAGDYLWRIDIEPYDQSRGPQQMPNIGQAPNLAGTLCLVTITVSYGHRPPLATLHTLTLARGA